MSGAVRLQVSDLGKRFGGVVAVKNMSFELRAGEITGLIGPNGSGKSTVMSLIMGLVRANSGAVKLDGVDIAGWPAHRIARAGVSIVFQHSRPLQRQTVLENVKLALLPDSLLRLATEASAAQRARAIAERVGLGGVLQRHPWTLPFADLRRMELAKAVARDPKVVLIDEPFAGLTTTEIKVFSDLIRTLRDEGRAVLLVDHSVKSVAALADRVIAMYLGERIAEGSADEVMQNETVRRVYIGGAIEAVERKGAAAEAAATLLDVDAVEVFYGKANALDRVALRVQQDEFVSIVGLNGAGKTTLFNAISGLVPYRGAIRFAGRDLKSLTAAAIARAGVVHCPETRELFGYMSVRENLDLGGGHLSKAERAAPACLGLRPVSDPRAAPGAGRAHAVRRRAANAHARTRIDDAAEAAHSRRADAGARSRHSRPAFQGDRTVAARALAHAAARRAERDVRPAPFRPRLCARPRPHYLARRSGALRAGNEHRVFVIRRHASKRRMAEAHPASFRSRMAASICGVKRRSDCQRLAKRSGSGKKPARKPAR